MKRRMLDAASAIGGRLIGGDGPFGEVSTDSRKLEPGSLFVALRGPTFDGADFAEAAAAAGAVGVIAERALSLTIPQIVVGDALAALQALARSWRESFDLPIVAVAGSNGKTTCKEMTAAILSQMGPCMATRGNLNNHIGVPLTLLRLSKEHRSAVVELGANRIGDVAALMPIVRPRIGVITNAGAEHLEGFGDLDGVATGEGETVACLVEDATAVINADDAFSNYWRGLAGARRITSFGMQASADFAAKEPLHAIERGEFVTRFGLVCPLGEALITLRVGGVHNVMNAVAAAAAAAAAGASLADIVVGLAGFRAVAGRLQLKSGPRNSWIIDDSYNANPSSVHAGLDVLGAQPGAKWLVLGDMGELGAYTDASHAEVGAYARDSGVTRLFGLGTLTTRAVEAFGGGAEWFSDVEALIRRLQAELAPGVTVLIKGSRVNHLERVVQALTGSGTAPGGATPLMRVS